MRDRLANVPDEVPKWNELILFFTQHPKGYICILETLRSLRSRMFLARCARAFPQKKRKSHETMPVAITMAVREDDDDDDDDDGRQGG